MNIIELIEKKKNGLNLTKEEYKWLIDEYVNGKIENYQMSSFLMAVWFQSHLNDSKGMTDEEAWYLTDAMLHSGDTINLEEIDGFKCDKHSTGGVGDKTSLAIGPMIASLGIKIAKMSGRGLGHTGGTLDKLESIPGFSIDVDEHDFIKQVKEIGIAIVGQTAEIVPADKKLYALRDVTGTVDSIPLIASSIMSKKLASGADIIILDVKVGSGAFMKNIDDAKKLANLMVSIGEQAGRKVVVLLTDMDQPLGNTIGNALEVIEAIETLSPSIEKLNSAIKHLNETASPTNFLEFSIELASYAYVACNKVSLVDARNKIKETLVGEISLATKKLMQMVELQHGDPSVILNPDKLKVSDNVYELRYDELTSKYIKSIDALTLGKVAMLLGAGRMTVKDKIDHSVGIKLYKKVGDFVKHNDLIAKVYYKKKFEGLDNIILELKQAFVFVEEEQKIRPIVYEVIGLDKLLK